MNAYPDKTNVSGQQFDDSGYGIPSPNYVAQSMGRDEYSGQNVEMAPLALNGSQFGQQPNPNSILNACADVNQQMVKINEAITSLQSMQKLSLDAVSDVQQKRARKQIDDLSSEIMALFRNVTGDVKSIKQNPEASSSKNAPQVERLSREITKIRQSYELSDSNYRKQLEAQIARQVKIVRPDASEAEIRAAVEDPNSQIFSQALMQSDRQGQAQNTRNNVRQRHEEIAKIESQMIELASLFEDMNNLVVQQEEAIVNVEMKGEEVVENVDKGAEELGVAIQSAKNARKWKWYCVGISILIIIVIGIIIAIYKFVVQSPATITAAASSQDPLKHAKRFILPNDFQERENSVIFRRSYPPSLSKTPFYA
ncbi:hypothetical protein Golomagni_02772 [Golovinomyces magnicellulatus]|nr:hypothetical protein Golomagni_02772 [Golovinomyces magnicellulatus]